MDEPRASLLKLRRVTKRVTRVRAEIKDEHEAQCVVAYEAGASLAEVATEAGLSVEKVRQILRARGATVRALGKHHGGGQQ